MYLLFSRHNSSQYETNVCQWSVNRKIVVYRQSLCRLATSGPISFYSFINCKPYFRVFLFPIFHFICFNNRIVCDSSNYRYFICLCEIWLEIRSYSSLDVLFGPYFVWSWNHQWDSSSLNLNYLINIQTIYG